MRWDTSVLRVAPEEFIVEGLSELLRKAGFTEAGREYKRVGSAKVAVVIGERENPFTGRETMVIGVTKGRADGEKLENVLKGYGENVILIPMDGLEGEIGGIRVLGPEWLAEAFNRYEIKPPGTLVEKFFPEVRREDFLKEFVLDGPLLETISPEKLVDEARKLISYRYGVDPEKVTPISLRLKLGEVHVFTWVSGGERRRALVQRDGVLLNADSGRLKGLAIRVLLEDVATVRASEVSFERIPSPEGLLMEEARKEGIEDVRIIESRQAYVPLEAILELGMGENKATVRFDLENGRAQARASAIREAILVEKVRSRIKDETGEEPSITGTLRRGKVLVVRGRTGRYLIEAEVNRYSGEVVYIRKTLNEGAMLAIILEHYPDGSIVGIERHSDSVFADVLSERGLVVLRIDPESGEVWELNTLIHPRRVLKEALKAFEMPFKEDEFKVKVNRVLWHRQVHAEFEGDGLTIRVAYNGETGEVTERSVEVTRKAAIRLALAKYPDFRLILDEEVGDGFSLTLEGERHILKLTVFRDGRIVETNRFLKRKAVEEIALKKIREIEDNPVIESLSLHEDWEVEFTGSKKFGKVVIHRTSGEVISFEYQYLESFLAKAFREFVEEEFGDSVEVEWVAHNLEEGFAAVRGTGKRGIYFAKFDTTSGEVVEHDFVSRDGLASRLKLAQVEGRYKP